MKQVTQDRPHIRDKPLTLTKYHSEHQNPMDSYRGTYPVYTIQIMCHKIVYQDQIQQYKKDPTLVDRNPTYETMETDLKRRLNNDKNGIKEKKEEIRRSANLQELPLF